MRNCETVVLKDLIQDSKDGEWGKESYFDDSTEMIVIRATDFEKVMGGRSEKIPQRFIRTQISERKKLFERDIILETAGGGKDRPTGRTILLNRKFCKNAQIPITCASFCRFIRIDVNRALPEYVYYKLQYLYNEGFMRQFHTQHTGVARFQYTTFSTTYQFEIPSYSSQKKIASILSNYDDLIENNARRIEILEQMAKLVYEEWFVKFRFPGHENVKMILSEFGEIPEGWEVKTLEEICSKVSSGGTPARKSSDLWENGNILWFKTKELTDGYLFQSEEMITDKGLKNSSAKLFSEETIVMAIYAAPTVGRLGILTKPSTFNQAACGLIPNPEIITTSFLFFKLLEMRNYFNSLAQGAAQQNINVRKVSEARIIAPPITIVKTFDNYVGKIMDEIKILSAKNQNLRKTRDLLLPKLISGEIDVSDLDIRMRNESQES